LVAFGVGVLIGVGLFALDKHFEITETVTAAYERGLDRLERWWKKFGPQANKWWNDFVNSGLVQDMEKGLQNMEKGIVSIGERLGQGDNALYMLQTIM
jgi:hypothetical protein